MGIFFVTNKELTNLLVGHGDMVLNRLGTVHPS
jgi:hypothetical protein